MGKNANHGSLSRMIRSFVSFSFLAIATGFLGWRFGFNPALSAVGNLPVYVFVFALMALLANALAAGWRLKIVANDIGHPIDFRKAIAGVSVGTLGGSAFFQLAGQLMARGAIMSRGGVPFASVVVITLYERAVAAIVSGLLALAGAYYIFGQIALDQNNGGKDFVKIVIGLLAATIAGALLGYGRRAATALSPMMTGHFAVKLIRTVASSLLVQLPMMMAYVILAHALSPSISINDLAAAACLVMFAASVPISLAGWGIREMSAVFALGAIGMGTGNAVLTAIIVGAGSLIIMAVLALVSVSSWDPPASGNAQAAPKIDYLNTLMWALPVAAATLILFQIYIPMYSGTLLNVNLADPVAILGGSIFLLQTVTKPSISQWRIPKLNLAIGAMTVVLAISLIAGATRFGYTGWAVVNRFLGWFVLLAYATTAALIVKTGDEEGLRTLLFTFLAATVAIVAIEYTLIVLKLLEPDASLPIVANAVQGFAQNRNAFAFQLLMALCAALLVWPTPRIRTLLIAVLFVGLWFCGSRSGWGAAAILILAALYLRTSSFPEMVKAVFFACLLALFPYALSAVYEAMRASVIATMHGDSLPTLINEVLGALVNGAMSAVHYALPNFLPEQSSTAERVLSMRRAWEMFYNHPILGAGLGAFKELKIMSSSGEPLVIHSTVLWILAEMGIFGLIVFGYPAFKLLITEFRRKERDTASKLLILCFLAFGVMSTPADMFYQRTFWFLIGAALAMRAPIQYEW
ncbi:MAG TPA: lysylphosphatidylglycerol synthase transmembrane domain-containing protein [Candidatus Acidoferrales bacterium]|nr:lysylphosphatidylglycerol synthase transmembrane domain-containing protein [Candidatus Acidoferrales bacterium]